MNLPTGGTVGGAILTGTVLYLIALFNSFVQRHETQLAISEEVHYRVEQVDTFAKSNPTSAMVYLNGANGTLYRHEEFAKHDMVDLLNAWDKAWCRRPDDGLYDVLGKTDPDGQELAAVLTQLRNALPLPSDSPDSTPQEPASDPALPPVDEHAGDSDQ